MNEYSLAKVQIVINKVNNYSILIPSATYTDQSPLIYDRGSRSPCEEG